MRGVIAGLLAAASLATAAVAGPPVSLPTMPGGERSFGDDRLNMARSGGLINEWRFRQEWQAMAQSYASALMFARCARCFNPDAAERMLKEPIGHEGEVEQWRDMVQQHRACVGEQSNVASLLLRAALAETSLRERQGATVPNTASLGVPESVDGYPLRKIARCQRNVAPEMTDAVLATDPGSETERVASEALFAATSSCGASRLGRLAPTVARIALVDAAWARIGDPGRSR